MSTPDLPDQLFKIAIAYPLGEKAYVLIEAVGELKRQASRIAELEAELGEAQRMALHKAAQYRASKSERGAQP